jgi:hypothetical protein
MTEDKYNHIIERIRSVLTNDICFFLLVYKVFIQTQDEHDEKHG